MCYVYSPSTNAFYATSLKPEYEYANSWPDNGVKVDNKTYQEYSNNPPNGKTRGATEKGQPCWINLPLPTSKQLAIAAESKKQSLFIQANTAIAPLQDAVDLDMATDTEKQLLTNWRKYRVLLNRVDVTAENITWPTNPVEEIPLV